MTTAKKPSIVLLYGAIAAGIMILFTLGTYFGGPEVFVGRVGYLKFVLVVGIALVAGIAGRRQNENYLEFRPALRIIFATMVIGMAVQTLFAWLLLTIDAHFKQRVIPIVIAQMEALYRGLKYSEDDVARNVAQLKTYDPFSFWNMMGGLAKIYIILFLVALALAAAVGQRKRVN